MDGGAPRPVPTVGVGSLGEVRSVMDHLARLEVALAATRPGARRGLASRVEREGSAALVALLKDVRGGDLQDLRMQAEELLSRGVRALIRGEAHYPTSLDGARDAPPALFSLGPLELLSKPTIGICGARNASSDGLRAAAVCGELAAKQGVVSVSGYARGVDSATHLASLEHGGGTVIVLPEGINHFRVKKGAMAAAWDRDRALVLSQFAPTQTWSAGAAMTRNGVIIGLSKALVVVEAGDTGGTLAAGTRALKLRRRVLALEFSATPIGNKMLLKDGAIPVRGRAELSELLDDLVHVADESVSTSGRVNEQFALSIEREASHLR